MPDANQPLSFAQLYFFDTHYETKKRTKHMNDLQVDILTKLQGYIRQVNPYVASFQVAIELSATEDISILLHHDKQLKPSEAHCRQYNLSMNSEVATLVPGDIKNPLDVIIYCLNGHVQKINSTHRSYDPLHYVLLLPEGTDGWQLNMKKSNGQILTAMNFYAYQLQVNNSWIVPYNPYLTIKYNTHINVEVVHFVQAVKYLYKYITKGQDRIIFSTLETGQPIPVLNEIENFVNARYNSASEAFWKLYGFYIHQKHPTVEKLPCHLPDEKTVRSDSTYVAAAVERGPLITKLTAYFQTNKHDEKARQILYQDFPKYYTWNNKTKSWQKRKRGTTDDSDNIKTDTIGRIPTISYNTHQSELFHLRILLHHIKGATIFDELKTVEGNVCSTFQETCMKTGLISNCQEIHREMEEAVSIRFGDTLHDFFAIVLIYCQSLDPMNFWEDWKTELGRDLLQRNNIKDLTTRIENEILIRLQE
ncbi:uncharacterized protein LOC106873110 [Octopus bimaculoides]|uniref:uncharacterized protein LOC106873110 n=1 Tax=Octopus bimaculoides TaxID=37653 RepID=UPI00071C36F7|nr:uncharacterized protein LOC106873110 [Octopus bimaculoides]|eukprot:XP_014775823.1 PREDICTED: uncharacterized protein LOC106873110 [Octopus bimaculoides]